MDRQGISFAKFWPPRAPRCGIARSAILARLAEVSAYQLALVLSPAGYGKTTVLAQHFSKAGKAGAIAAWASIDRNDATARQFAETLLSAFSASDRRLGRSAQAILAAGVDDDRIRPAMLALLRDIGALEQPVELIIDDFHFAENAATLEVIETILAASPANLSLIVSSRFVPKLPISTLRLRGQLMEFGTEDLRFNEQEAEAYLSAIITFPLSLGEIGELHRHASGWPLALQAAAISLSQIGNARTFINQYDLASTDLSRFIGANVFSDLEPWLRTFALEIAQLESFNAPLCAQVSGLTDGEAGIRALERHNLFIEPFGKEEGWFRFHGLFRDFLLQHQDRPKGARLRSIHRSAHGWLRAHAQDERAISHAFAAELWPEAADLIEASWRGLINRAQFEQLKHWLYSLPSGMLEDRPILQVALAWTEGLQRRPDLASGRIAQLMLRLGMDRSQLGPDHFESNPIARDLFVLQAAIDVMRDDAQEVGKLAQLESRDLETLGGAAMGGFQYGLILNCLTHARVMVGQFDAAQRVGHEARQLYRESEHILICVHSDLFCGFAHQICGDLRQAYDMFLSAHERTLETFRHPYAAPQYLMAAILYEWNEIAEARALLERSKDALVVPSILEPIIELYLTRARIAAASGDHDAALATLCDAELAGRESGSRRLRVVALAERARMLLAQGQLADAQQIERELLQIAVPGRSPADTVWPRSQSLVTQISACIRIAEGRAEQARDLIRPYLAAALATGRTAYAIKYLAIDAVAAHTLGEREAAANQLARAFLAGSRSGWKRTLHGHLDGHTTLIADGLNRAMATGVPLEYLRELAAVLNAPQSGWIVGPSKADRAFKAETLTKREQELLRALCAGKTNKEIARILWISDNTVAWHLKNLFNKLSVNTRTEAADVARRIGLIG